MEERANLLNYLRSLENEAYIKLGSLAFREIYWDEILEIYVIELAPLPVLEKGE